MNDAEFIKNNMKVVEEFRAKGGKIAGGAPLILRLFLTIRFTIPPSSAHGLGDANIAQ